MSEEEKLEGGGRTLVHRRGDVVFRQSGPWSATVIAYLRHLEKVGFDGSPRVVGNGFDDQGREMLTFLEGDFVHPSPWTEDALPALGDLLRRLHHAGESFRPPSDAAWQQWYGRGLGDYKQVYGHCDLGPWNILARAGRPVALIDWETAGPVDALFELGQTCWLNAQLHGDDVAERVGLATPDKRAKHAAMIADGYGLPKSLSKKLAQAMIDVATADAADQAIHARVTPDTVDVTPLWGLAWRARAADWMMRHRLMIAQALA